MSVDWTALASSVGDFLYHISPALVTVLFGGLIIQRFFVSRANEAVLIDYFLKELDILRADTLDYWNLDCKNGNADTKDKAAILEQKMKGAIRSLSAELDHYSKHYQKGTDFMILMVEVSDACTGGDFESPKRARDRGRYLPAINAINRVKSALRVGKL